MAYVVLHQWEPFKINDNRSCSYSTSPRLETRVMATQDTALQQNERLIASLDAGNRR